MRSAIPVRILLKGLLRSPELISPVARGLLRKHLSVEHDYRHATGEALHAPRQISVRITNACNHRCAVCGQYGRHGYMHESGGAKLLETLDFEQQRALVDEMAPHSPIFYYTGGEPFLYPRFPELMNHVKEKGLTASVVTNGVRLEEHAAEMVANGWDLILVSMDGPPEVHDACRNFAGAFETAFRGMRALQDEKRAQNRVKPFLAISTTLSPTNAPHLEETFELVSDLRPDLMILYLSWFTSEAIGRAHARLLEKRLGVTPFTWRSYATEFSPSDAGALADAVRRIRRRSWPFEYVVIPNIAERDLEDYYLDPARLFGYRKCAAPFFMVDIMPNGDVVTCRDFIDVRVGNIRQTPLMELWNSERFVAFRKLLIDEGGTLPQCSRCCGLMGF